MTKPTRAILTLALGKPLYLEMAYNLARSFFWWHRDSDIQFFLASDRELVLPPELSQVKPIRLAPGQYGEGFTPKLHLDVLAPAQKTLFIDADCLCVGSLGSVFARFDGRPVGVVGGSISTGEWFGDITALCRHLGVDSLPKFNGGIYYLEKVEPARQVYAKARELETGYDALGLKRLRNRPNDEVLMAMAMAIHRLEAIPDDGSILSDPQACQGPLSLHVLRGGSCLVNPPAPSPLHQPWYPLHEVSPVVVHFLGDYHHTYQYRSAVMSLRYAFSNPLARLLGTVYATLTIKLPGWLWAELKPRLRNVYRRFFGTRAVRASDRL